MANLKLSLLIFVSLNIVDILGSNFAWSNSTVCESGKCLKKCCPQDMYIMYRKKRCSAYTSVLNFSMPVFDESLRETGKSLDDVFYLEANAFSNITFKRHVYEAKGIGFNVYLAESGVMYLELPNAFQRWTPLPTDRYCIDYLIPTNVSGPFEPRIGIWGMFAEDVMIQGNNFFTTGMITSCVFLILVLVVYFLLPELRNLGGLVLMAYVFSLLCAFLFLMIVQRGGLSIAGCVGMTLTVYYFFLASFCWMNIMSYDIWWTFRGYAKARPIHRRGEKFKFCMYCLYAWGVPLAMSIMLAVLNYADLKHVPWFITPKIPDRGCFLEGGEKLVYLYVPMLVMILLNWLFFLMTAFNIWRLSRGTAVLDSAAAGSPAAHRTHRHRLLLYLKLSILMGLNWILEVASSFKPDLNIWYITDAYNLFIGLAIFLIFVCKKKIFKKLLKKYRAHRQSKSAMSFKSRSSISRSNSTTESSHIHTMEAQPLQMCPNPRGPM